MQVSLRTTPSPSQDDLDHLQHHDTPLNSASPRHTMTRDMSHTAEINFLSHAAPLSFPLPWDYAHLRCYALCRLLLQILATGTNGMVFCFEHEDLIPSSREKMVYIQTTKPARPAIHPLSASIQSLSIFVIA